MPQTATLNGWVNTYRSYNNQVFVDLRDRYGVTQVVFEAEDKELFQVAEELRNEFVLSVTGSVAPRLPGKENPKLATGKVELKAQKVRVLNGSPTPPFEITEFGNELANEDVRLQHRYLDLRRKTLQDTLALRHRLCKVIRDNLDARGFLHAPLGPRTRVELTQGVAYLQGFAFAASPLGVAAESGGGLDRHQLPGVRTRTADVGAGVTHDVGRHTSIEAAVSW